MAAADQLTGLMNLLSGIKGSEQTTKTSGGTQTQQTQLSDVAVNEQIKKILAGSGGVKDIGSRARSSGIYNSTSEDTLLGNLYATAAAQGEIARAPTVVTSSGTTTKTESPGVGIGATLGTIAGAAVLNKVLSAGTDYLGSTIGDLISGGNGGSGKKGIQDITAGGGFGGQSGETGFGSSGEGFGIDPGIIGGFGASTDFTKSSSGSKGFNIGLDADTGDTSFGITGLGGLGGLLGSVISSMSGSSGSSGYNRGGGSSGGSIICTALMEKGELNAEHYAAGSRYIEQVSPVTKIGYYYWAVEVARKIRGGNKTLLRICRPFARGRTALLATRGSFLDHVKHPVGSLTKFVGEPTCWVIGAVVILATVNAEVKSQSLEGV